MRDDQELTRQNQREPASTWGICIALFLLIWGVVEGISLADNIEDGSLGVEGWAKWAVSAGLWLACLSGCGACWYRSSASPAPSVGFYRQDVYRAYLSSGIDNDDEGTDDDESSAHGL